MTDRIRQLVQRFLREESGQDLIEYGLLTAIVTLSSIVVFATIRGRMADLYDSWRTDFQDAPDGIPWIPPPPAS